MTFPESSFERLKGASGEGYLDVAPELIAEIVSSNDRWTDINLVSASLGPVAHPSDRPSNKASELVVIRTPSGCLFMRDGR